MRKYLLYNEEKEYITANRGQSQNEKYSYNKTSGMIYIKG